MGVAPLVGDAGTICTPRPRGGVWRAREEAPKTPPIKRPGLHPKIDEQGKRLLQAQISKSVRLPPSRNERREFLQRVAGVKVSDSTVSRMLKRMGWSRK